MIGHLPAHTGDGLDDKVHAVMDDTEDEIDVLSIIDRVRAETQKKQQRKVSFEDDSEDQGRQREVQHLRQRLEELEQLSAKPQAGRWRDEPAYDAVDSGDNTTRSYNNQVKAAIAKKAKEPPTLD
jgi:pyruvate/2-oxoacid:ferredoxin oxidoreductase beta subunit